MSQGKIVYIDPNEILVDDAWNTRHGDFTKDADEETGKKWDDFVASCADGIHDPVEATTDAKGRLKLLAGYRRIKAAKINKLKTVPVMVRELDEKAARIRNLQENVGRQDIKPSDFAYGIGLLAKDHGLSAPEIVKATGRSQPYIAKLLKIVTDTTPKVFKRWREEVLEVSTDEMYALARLNKDRQEEEYDNILRAKAAASSGPDQSAKMKAQRERAYKYAAKLGWLQKLDLLEMNIDLDDVDAWLQVCEESCGVPKKATTREKKSVAEAARKGFNEGFTKEAEEDEEEEEEETTPKGGKK